jgi:hypothetical protein
LVGDGNFVESALILYYGIEVILQRWEVFCAARELARVAWVALHSEKAKSRNQVASFV